MDQSRELARLNLVLEMVSECASLADIDEVERLVGARLRWIFDFERCELALVVPSGVAVAAMGPGDETLVPVAGGLAASHGRDLLERALASGAPAAAGRPIASAAYPLGAPERPLGALFLTLAARAFSHRDLRLLQHVGASIGAVLSRIDRERVFESEREAAAIRDEQGRRERAARDEAIAANAAKDRFLAMLGHELRNPLAPIIASATLLRGEVSGQAATRVEVIERQARHLGRLVSDLLDASRVTSGKVSLRRSPSDLGDVALKAAEMARPGMEVRQQTLDLRLPTEPIFVDGDEARLAQVLSNLLNNASLYSSRGSQVLLEVKRCGHEVEATVMDQGIGMSPDTLAGVFDMFVQGERSQELAPGGLGLGLGVARALVEAHGGSISAHSAGEGLGSSFRVTLPALERRPEPVAPAQVHPFSAASGASQSLRVLMVDDNADAADSMAEILRVMGHEVLVAYSPEDALRAAPDFAPEVAVLDIGMPGMDGRQLAAALRTLLANPPRMIALSGFGQERDRAESCRRGFHAHLVKPANIVDLLAALDGCLTGLAPIRD